MTSAETLAITYGVGSGFSWGAGDFSGGLAAKETGVFSVILYSQVIGGLFLLGVYLALGGGAPAGVYLLWGGLAGVWGALGLACLYRGLAVGRMGMVAPVSAVVTAVGPVIFAFFTEGMPPNTQLAGFAGAIFSVWLFSPTRRSRGGITATELGLASLSGVCFSLFFIFIDRASSQAVLAPLVAARVASIVLMAAILAARRELAPPARGPLPRVALAGVMDAVGNTFFALASRSGRLDVAVILVSAVYPVATVVLARVFLRERLRPRQRFGLLTTAVSLALIAS